MQPSRAVKIYAVRAMINRKRSLTKRIGIYKILLAQGGLQNLIRTPLARVLSFDWLVRKSDRTSAQTHNLRNAFISTPNYTAHLYR